MRTYVTEYLFVHSAVHTYTIIVVDLRITTASFLQQKKEEK
jgi:hypothetical protein